MTLTIRKEQMEVFASAAVRNFEDRMVKYLAEYFPGHCDDLGEAKVREIVHRGWERAKGYEMTSERSVSLFISMMFMLGSGFDADPQLPWAAEMLRATTRWGEDEPPALLEEDEEMQSAQDDEQPQSNALAEQPQLLDEDARIDLLYDKAMEFLDQVCGDSNQYLDEVAGRMRRQGMETGSQAAEAGPEFYSRMLIRLTTLFPQKYSYIGEFNVRRLIQHGLEAAHAHGIRSERGVAVYISLMFVFGSSFDTDPILPWSAEVLRGQGFVPEENRKVERLYNEAAAYLERILG
jgi:hypothetical protein